MALMGSPCSITPIAFATALTIRYCTWCDPMHCVQNVRGNFATCCQSTAGRTSVVPSLVDSTSYSLTTLLDLHLSGHVTFAQPKPPSRRSREHEYCDLSLIDWETLYRGSPLIFGTVREDNSSDERGGKLILCLYSTEEHVVR